MMKYKLFFVLLLMFFSVFVIQYCLVIDIIKYNNGVYIVIIVGVDEWIGIV